MISRTAKGGGLTLDDIGELYGITGEAVRQILKKALKKIAKNKRLENYIQQIGVDYDHID